MTSIAGLVGRGGRNARRDVATVQGLLNAQLHNLTPLRPLTVDGLIGGLTIEAIETFQRRVLKTNRPDGRVDPGGRTLRHLGGGMPATQRRLPGFSVPAEGRQAL